jgi:hypothetical protein
MHLPEVVLHAGCLGSLGGCHGVLVNCRERKISENEIEIWAKLLLQLF